MLRRLRSHLTYANVMATIAVFLALSGGAAVALNGSNTRVKQGGCAPTMAGTGAMVKVGSFCIDKYEASVWSSPKGGTQYGVSSDDYPCNDDGQNCSNIYARSVAGVAPSRHITWFQAQQALANSGKRLPSNAEWQEAVRGTPDAGPDNGTTDCNTGDPGTPFGTGSLVGTGSRSSCVSDWGAYDMVGNLNEWVADWVPASDACPGWDAAGNFSSDDTMCLAGASRTRGPGALVRGNDFGGHRSAGPFTVYGINTPSSSNQYVGFRGAR
jgi:formylglycine-generating enzyme required for sulfatase activity